MEKKRIEDWKPDLLKDKKNYSVSYHPEKGERVRLNIATEHVPGSPNFINHVHKEAKKLGYKLGTVGAHQEINPKEEILELKPSDMIESPTPHSDLAQEFVEGLQGKRLKISSMGKSILKAIGCLVKEQKIPMKASNRPLKVTARRKPVIPGENPLQLFKPIFNKPKSSFKEFIEHIESKKDEKKSSEIINNNLEKKERPKEKIDTKKLKITTYGKMLSGKRGITGVLIGNFTPEDIESHKENAKKLGHSIQIEETSMGKADSNPSQYSTPEKFTKEELVAAIRQDIIAEHDAVNLYEAHKAASDNKDFNDALGHIIIEEKEHVNELQGVLHKLDPGQKNVEKSDKGVPPFGPVTTGKHSHKLYRCTNCGHKQTIGTNHTGNVLDYCHGCSWKPSAGKGYSIPALGGHTYREFTFAEDENGINKYMEEQAKMEKAKFRGWEDPKGKKYSVKDSLAAFAATHPNSPLKAEFDKIPSTDENKVTAFYADAPKKMESLGWKMHEPRFEKCDDTRRYTVKSENQGDIKANPPIDTMKEKKDSAVRRAVYKYLHAVEEKKQSDLEKVRYAEWTPLHPEIFGEAHKKWQKGDKVTFKDSEGKIQEGEISDIHGGKLHIYEPSSKIVHRIPEEDVTKLDKIEGSYFDLRKNAIEDRWLSDLSDEFKTLAKTYGIDYHMLPTYIGTVRAHIFKVGGAVVIHKSMGSLVDIKYYAEKSVPNEHKKLAKAILYKMKIFYHKLGINEKESFFGDEAMGILKISDKLEKQGRPQTERSAFVIGTKGQERRYIGLGLPAWEREKQQIVFQRKRRPLLGTHLPKSLQRRRLSRLLRRLWGAEGEKKTVGKSMNINKAVTAFGKEFIKAFGAVVKPPRISAAPKALMPRPAGIKPVKPVSIKAGSKISIGAPKIKMGAPKTNIVKPKI